MGQMTHAIILGVDASEHTNKLGGDGWYSILSKYKSGNGPKPDNPCGDTAAYDVIGFWVAVGGSGEKGCPDLSNGFPLDGFLEVPEYRKAYDRALIAWGRFQPWMASRGFRFGPPRLWFVQTEVA